MGVSGFFLILEPWGLRFRPQVLRFSVGRFWGLRGLGFRGLVQVVSQKAGLGVQGLGLGVLACACGV